MSRKIITFCVTILLILTCSYTVFAEEFDQSKTGSISVTLIEKKQNEPIVGAELSVYYVATVIMDENGNLIYDYTNDFKQLDCAIDDAELATKLQDYLAGRITADTLAAEAAEQLKALEQGTDNANDGHYDNNGYYWFNTSKCNDLRNYVCTKFLLTCASFDDYIASHLVVLESNKLQWDNVCSLVK